MQLRLNKLDAFSVWFDNKPFIFLSSDYKGIEHSTNLLEDIKIYENYVPEDLVEESIVSLKKSLSKEIEKII
jgi:hypothetical protein